MANTLPRFLCWWTMVFLAGARVAGQAPIFDVSFVPQPSGAVRAVAYQADGKLLVGGSFTRIAAVTRNNLARLEVTGVADTGFTPSVSGGTVEAIAFQSSGKILIAGSFSSVSGVTRSRIARLNTDGTVDVTFDAPIVGSTVRTLLVLPDDRILVGGSFTSISNQPRLGLARLHANGSLDGSFVADLDGVVTVGSRVVQTIARQVDGRIVFGGQFGSVNGVARRGLARVSADGALDAGFDPAGSSLPSITALVVQRDGRILVGGSFSMLAGQLRANLGRLNPDGTLDLAFNPAPNSAVFALKEEADGNILAGGVFTAIAGVPRSYLARLEANGALDASFTVEASGATIPTGPGVQTIAISTGKHVTFGGSFAMVAGATRTNLARMVPPAPQIIVTAPTVVTVAGQNYGITPLVLGAGGTYQWRKDGAVVAGATSPTLTLNAAQAGDAGAYTLTVTNSFGTATSAPITVIAGITPSFTAQPASVAVVAGQAVTFTAAATGTPTPGFQWRRNGTSIAGATNASLTIAAVNATHAGEYSVIASNGAGFVTSVSATLTLVPAARLANVSVRASLANAQSLIVGFVVGGGSTEVLVRAAGPALTQFGLPTAMADPRLELFRDSTKLLENDSWPAGLGDVVRRVGAFPFEPDSRDAALMQSVAGAHSAVASGAGAGVVLVEAYDAGVAATGRLINVSARNHVGTDADILIAGFSVGGSGPLRVLIRAVGPTLGLAPFGLPGVLADPRLEVFSGGGVKLVENDNWEAALATTIEAAGAFRLAPGSRDAALVVMLAGGQSYTAQVSGVNRGTGAALVEIFELRFDDLVGAQGDQGVDATGAK